jgi:hypothetical protein
MNRGLKQENKMKNERDVGPVIPDPEPINSPPPEPTKKGSAIAIRDGETALSPADHNQLLAIIDRLIEAKAVPKHLENRFQVLAAWNFAAQLKLPPQPSLRNIAVIEGNPSLFGDLPLSLVQAHKDFVFYREYLLAEDYREICIINQNLSVPIFAGVVEIQRKGMKKPEQYTFTVDDAVTAGLVKFNEKEKRYAGIRRDGSFKTSSPWTNYFGTMMIRRARGKGVKAHFADALCGAGIAEYDFHVAPDLENVRDVTNDERPHSPEFASKIDDLD